MSKPYQKPYKEEHYRHGVRYVVVDDPPDEMLSFIYFDTLEAAQAYYDTLKHGHLLTPIAAGGPCPEFTD